MCGFAGFILPEKVFDDSGLPALRRMTAAIVHRGPDAEGHWADGTRGVALGHRRLSILDLSPAGAQPMQSTCGRYVIVFNGEIYNHLALRAALVADDADCVWRGHSDTETLLAAFAAWGVEATLRKSFGMFALAVWDRAEEVLMLARDRMGEKPLYYAKVGGGWAFGSELRALMPAPGFVARIDRRSVEDYLAYGYVPDSRSILAGVGKVPPGQILRICGRTRTARCDGYELFEELALDRGRSQRGGTDKDFEMLSRDMETLLGDVVEEQMISDVPLGCFLSGGIDSSLVASLMQSRRSKPIQTFSIGFDVDRFNEAPHAARVARHLGTEHTEFPVSEDDALSLVPQLAEIYDEPFADSSQIPTTLLCRAARRAVTVALTGDGGDEVFGGYNRHVTVPRLWSALSRIPQAIRGPLGHGLGKLTALGVGENALLRAAARKSGLPVTTIDKLSRLGPTLGEAKNYRDLYGGLVRTFQNPAVHLTGGSPTYRVPGGAAFSALPAGEWAMAMDSISYLPGDILVKVDRAAMSASLETRTPFLDARVIRAAWTLPFDALVRGRQGKFILRDILHRYVPRDIIDRPKQGFAVPLDRWLRGALRPWAQNLLDRADLFAAVGLREAGIKALWAAHLQEKANHGQQVWTILMLLLWIDHLGPDRLLPADPGYDDLEPC